MARGLCGHTHPHQWRDTQLSGYQSAILSWDLPLPAQRGPPAQGRHAHLRNTRAFLFPGAQRQKARPCQGRLTTPSFMGTISLLPWGRSRLAHGRCCSSDRCRSAHSSELSSCPHRSAFSLTPSRTQCRSPFFQAARPALRFWAKRKLTSGDRACPAWLVHYDSSPHVLSQFSSSNEPTSDLGNASV